MCKKGLSNFKKSPYRVRGTSFSHTLPPHPAWSLRSLTLSSPPPVKKILAAPVLAYYSRSHENIRHFQRRSLANYNYYMKRQLKARYYNFAPPPLLFGGNYYIVIFAKNMHQKTVYFRALDAKFLLPRERRNPSQILPLSVASLPRSSPRRSAHPDFRIPRQFSSYGPAYTCLQIICYVSRCSVLNCRRTSYLSVVLPNPLFFPS